MLTITSISIFLVCILFSKRYHTTHFFYFLIPLNPIENHIVHVSDKPCYSVTQKNLLSYLTTGFGNYKSVRREIERDREDRRRGKVVALLKM